MIRSLKIQHFRSHRSIQMKNLGRINLITGMNNTGKTVALEAIFLLSLANYPQIALTQLNRLRGYASSYDIEEAWDSLFYDWDRSREIIIEVEEDDLPQLAARSNAGQKTIKRSMHIRPLLTSEVNEIPEGTLEQEKLFDSSEGVIESVELIRRTRGLLVRSSNADEQPIIQRVTNISPEIIRTQRLPNDLEDEIAVAFIPAKGSTSSSQEAQRYSRLQISRREGEVLELLQIIDPRLRGLVVGATKRGSAIYGDLGAQHLMPLSVMGDGMSRTLSIALSMVNSQDGVVLIDEVENGLHYSVLVSLWKLIARTARRLNVQVFAATHSDECIKAVNEAIQELEYTSDLRLYRFDLLKEGTRVTDYNSQELTSAIDTDQEVR